MTKNNNYLYLIWKDPQTRLNYTIGKLYRGEKYTLNILEKWVRLKIEDGQSLKFSRKRKHMKVKCCFRYSQVDSRIRSEEILVKF